MPQDLRTQTQDFGVVDAVTADEGKERDVVPPEAAQCLAQMPSPWQYAAPGGGKLNQVPPHSVTPGLTALQAMLGQVFL